MSDDIVGPAYDVTKVAQALNVHVSTVHRWIHSGVRGRRLESILVGGRRKILRISLEAFLRPQEEQKQSEAVSADRNRLAQQQLAAYGLTPRTRRDGRS